MAGHAVLQLQEPAQKRFLGFRKQRHVDRALPATQDRAQRDHQKFMEIMQRGIAGSRVIQTLPTGGKLIQGIHLSCDHPAQL